MNNYGELIAPDTVVFKRLLPASIDTVWEYLVDGEKRAKWLAAGDFDQHVGGRIEFKFHNASLSTLPDDPPPNKYCGLPEHMNYEGKVIACEPKSLFSHTWIDEGVFTEVTYELLETSDGVLLTLTHRMIADDMLMGVLGGWHTHLDILVDVMNGKEPRPFWKTHTSLEEEYTQRVGQDSN